MPRSSSRNYRIDNALVFRAGRVGVRLWDVRPEIERWAASGEWEWKWVLRGICSLALAEAYLESRALHARHPIGELPRREEQERAHGARDTQ